MGWNSSRANKHALFAHTFFLRKRLRFAMVLRKTMLHTPASTLVLHVWAFAPMNHDVVGQTVVGVDQVIVISLGVTCMMEHKFGDAGWADC